MSKATGDLIVLHDRRDRPEANRLVRKLESVGYRVARQDKPAGLRRGKLDAPTVVLWSHHAGAYGMRSALDSDSSVIAKLDSRAAPFGAPVTDLRGWRGQDAHQGWKSLLAAVGPANATPANPAAAAPVARIKAPASKSVTKAATAAPPVSGAVEAKSKGLSGVAIAVIFLIVMAVGAGVTALFVL